jgi:hypothetical protein
MPDINVSPSTDFNQSLKFSDVPVYKQTSEPIESPDLGFDRPFDTAKTMSTLEPSGEEFAKSISYGPSINDIINDLHNYETNMQNNINNYQMRKAGLSGSEGYDPQKGYNDVVKALNPKTPTMANLNQPIVVGPESSYKRYAQSTDFQQLGFNSSEGDEQEYKYGRAMTWGDTIGKALGGGSRLAADTFVEGWKGWARIGDALISWDSSKLMGSPEEQYEMAQAQEDIMNKYAIYDTAESKDGFFNRQFFGNMLQQSGFAVGAGLQFAAEELLTAGLATAFKPIKEAYALGKVAESMALGKTIKSTKTLAELSNDTRKVMETITSSKKVTNAFSTAARKIIPLYGTVQDMINLGTAGAGGFQLSMIGLGGIKRTFSEFNMARSESIFEAAGTYKKMTDDLIQEYRINNNGELPTGETLEKIKQYSEDAAHDNFWTNIGVLSVMNRIQFDNLSKPFSLSRKIFNEEAASLEGKAFEVVGKIAGKEEKRAFQTGMLGRLGAIPEVAKTFGKKTAAWEATKAIGKGLMKFEGSEGLQELIQEASNKGLTNYYTDLYHGTKGYTGKLGNVMDEFSKEFPLTSTEGMKTFLMGALTGRLISPLTMIQERTIGYKQYKDNKIKAKEAVENLNAFYSNADNWKKESIANVKIQNKAAETMEEAAKNHNRYVFNNHKDSAFGKAIASAIKLNMFDSMRDTIKGYGEKMNDEEFKQAFGIESTPENKKNVKSFMGEIVSQMEEYHIAYENLKDKYANKILPELYKYNKPEDYAAYQIGKMAVDDAIEILATNLHKSRQAVKRASALQTEISANKNIGGSSMEVLTKMGNLKVTEDHISLLKQELTALTKEGIETTPEQKELIKDKKEELKLAEQWHSSFSDLLSNTDESYSPAVEGRAYDAFVGLVNLFNKVSKFDKTISKEDFDDVYIKFNDYVRLNDDNKSYIDAMNLLANPINMNLIANSMSSAIKETKEEFKEEQKKELEKVGGKSEKPEIGKHIVRKEKDGKFSVINSDGDPIAVFDTEEEAQSTADDLNEEIEDIKTEEQGKLELEKIKTEIKQKPSFNLDVIFDSIGKVLGITAKEVKEKYNVFLKQLDQESIQKDLKELGLQDAVSEEEIANIVGKYTLPKFVDFLLNTEKFENVSDIEAKRAKLEKLKQTPEGKEIENRRSLTTVSDEAADEDNYDGYYENKVSPEGSDEFVKTGEWIGTYINKAGEKEEVVANSEKEILDALNAKYDAELDALKSGKPEEVISQDKKNHDIIEIFSKKRKLTKPSLEKGELLVDDGKDGVFIINKNGEYRLVESTGEAPSGIILAQTYNSKAKAIAAREQRLLKEVEENKKAGAYYSFAGTEIRAGLIVTDNNTGKNYVVDTRTQPFFLEEDTEKTNPLIKLVLLKNRTRQNTESFPKLTEKQFRDNFTIKQKTETLDTGEPIDQSIFRLFRTNELSGIYPHRREGENEDAAQARMDEILKTTNANDFRKNVVIRIKENKNVSKEKNAGGKGKNANPNLKQFGEKYQIQIVYNGEPLGYLRNFDTLRYVTDNGVYVPMSNLTKNQFRSIFDLKGRGIEKQMLEFKNAFENSQKVYIALSKFVKPGVEVEITSEQLNKILRFDIGAGDFDFVPKGTGISFEQLSKNTVDGFYYIIDRAKRYGKGYTYTVTETVKTNAFGSDKTKIDNEVKQIRNERDTTEQLGRYVAVVRLDNGRLRFIELNTDVLNDDVLETFIKEINERTKETKEKNIQEKLNDKKEIIYERKKVDFNEKLNSELASTVFISVPGDKKGVYIDFGVSDTGNLELTFHNKFLGKDISRRKIRLHGKTLADPVTIDSIDDLISKINAAIEKHDKSVIVSGDAIGFKLTRENFRQGVPDVLSYDEIKKLKTNLSDKIVKNVPISVKASSDLPAPEIKTGTTNKGSEPSTKGDEKNNAGVQIDENKRNEFFAAMGVNPSASNPVTGSQQDSTEETPLQKISKKIDVLKRDRQAEKEKIRDEKINAGVRASTAIREADAEATALYKKRIEEATNEFKNISNSNKGAALKITNKPDFDSNSVVNIDQFKKYVSRILGDVVTVSDIDIIANNLKNGNITVGRFIAYLQKLQNGTSIVKGRIEVGENTPFKYHEAFHAIFRLMLDDTQITKFLNYAKIEVKQKLVKEGKTLASELKAMRSLHTIYEEMTDKELEERYYEEYMADKFDEWKLEKDSNKTSPGIRGLFQKIWNFIKELFNKLTRSDIEGLFHEIDRGRYRNSKIADNRFTKADALSINEPVLKSIKIGEDIVEDENGFPVIIDKYLSQQDGDQIASNIASMFHTRVLNSKTEQYNKREVLNGIVDDFIDLYNPEGERQEFYNDEIDKLYEIDPAQAEAYSKKLDQKFEIFTNSDNRETLLEAVDVHLRIMGFQQELEDDEFTSTEDEFGTRVTVDNWKEAHSIGGFGSLSKFLRQYIAATTYVRDNDEFGNTEMINGEPLLQAVNANLVYNGILKSVANITDQKKFVNRLLQMRNSNTETGKFLNKFFNEVGLEVDENTGEFTINNPKQATLFQMVVKGFQQYTVDYIFINKDIRVNNKVSRLMVANRMGVAKTQFTQWQNAYIHQFETPILRLRTEEEKKEFAREKSSSLEDLLNAHDSSLYLSDEKLDDLSQSISNQLKEDLGIALSPLYIKFSIAASKKTDLRTEDQRKLAESYSEVDPMSLDGLKAMIKSVQALENPFAKNIDSEKSDVVIPGEEEDTSDDLGEGGNITRLTELAKGNAIFDETVSGTSYKNAEGELVYAHQLPTFHLVKINTLNDSDDLNKIKQDEFLEGNHLLSSEEFNSLLGDLRIERIEGMKSSILKEDADGDLKEDKTIQANQNDGITYGSFSDREFLISLLELYQYNKEKSTEDGKFMTTQHLVRVIEASNTGDTISLPVIKTVKSDDKGKVVLTTEAISILSKEVAREFNRIRKVRAEIKTGIYEEGEIEGYHYAVDGEGRRTDKKQPRGLMFYKMANMLGAELASELEQASKDENFDITSKAAEINSRIKEYWEQQIEKFVEISNELGIITVSKTEEGNEEEISNNLIDDFLNIGFTNTVDGKSEINERKNNLLNIKPGNIKYNLAQILVNDYINTLSINQILYGDEAKAFKDEIDQVKRAKGANGSGPSLYSTVLSPELGITHAFDKSYILTFSSPKYKAIYAGGLKDKADAQSYQTVKSMRYTLHGLGELNVYRAKILDKLEAGEKLTSEEIFGKGGLKAIEGMFNSKKLVYFDGPQYIKTSTVMLTKEFTSMKVDGKWVAIPGSEELHDLRERMEKFEKDNNTVTFACDKTASKGVKKNIFEHTDGFKNAKDENFVEQDTNYWRLQLVNPSNKLVITDPTQAKQIIIAEQDDTTPVTFMGQDITVGELKKLYFIDTDQRLTNNYTRTRDEIFDIEEAFKELGKSIDQNKITAKLGKFQEKAIDMLRSTGSDSQLIEFFSIDSDGKPKYNLNNNITLDKFTQLFLAYFSKGVMSEKSPGHSVALMANYGKKVVKVFTGRYDENGVPIGQVVSEDIIKKNYDKYKNAKRWNNDIDREFTGLNKGDIYVDDLRHNVPEYDSNGKIIGRFTEFLMPPHFAEYLNLKPGQPIPDHIAKMFGVRIPSQDKHSFISLKLVGFMPAYYGSTAIFPHELIEISGADFDIDKLYMHIYDTYSKGDRRVPYGSRSSKEGKFEEYVRWNLDNNKSFKDDLNKLKETNPRYQEVIKKIANLKKLEKDIDLAYDNVQESEDVIKEGFKTAIMASRFVDNIVSQLVGPFNLSDKSLNIKEYSDTFNTLENSYFIKDLNESIDKLDEKEKRDFILSMGVTWFEEFQDLSEQLKDIESKLISDSLKLNKLPSSIIEYAKEKKELNNGVLNNRILEQKINLLNNQHMTAGGNKAIAFEVASVKALSDLLDEDIPGSLIDLLSTVDEQGNKVLPKDIEKILIEGKTDVDSIIGKYKAYKNNKEGSRNIGPAVNSMLVYAILNNFKINLRDTAIDSKTGLPFKMYKFKLNGHEFSTYGETRSFNFETGKYDSNQRIFNTISTIVSAMTDNAKERLAARLGLNIEAVGYVSNMVAQGIPLNSAIMFMLQPAIREYFELTKIASNNIKTSSESEIYKSKIANELLENYKKEAGEEYAKEELTDELLIDNIKNNGASALYQASVMEDFIGIINQSKYYASVAQVLKLTKGLGTSFEDYDKINDKIDQLGLRLKDDDDFELHVGEGMETPPPFDLRQVLMGYNENKTHHNFIAKYIKIADQINQISKGMFLERTAVFKRIENIVKDNLDVKPSLKEKFNTDLKRDLISYLSLKAYRKFLADTGRAGTLSTMTNALIYDEAAVAKGEQFSDIVDIIRAIREKLPNNYIAKNFLNVISTTVVNAKGEAAINSKNKDGINKLESNTWAKLSEYQIEKLRDSFIEIYQSDIDFDGNGRNGRNMANALFNYLLVKDGGQFRSGSFIKFIPNFMFIDLLESTGKANDVLKLDFNKKSDEEYKKIFGLTGNDLFNEFMSIYTTHVANGYYVKKVKLNNEPKFEKIGVASVDDFEPKSVIVDGDKLKINIFNGAKIKEQQKAFTQEEEAEITWMDDADYYEMLSEMTEEEKTEVQSKKVKSFKYTDDEKKRFSKNMQSLRAKGFYTNKEGDVVFPYIIRQKGGERFAGDTYYILKSVTKVGKQPKESIKKLIQPGETTASGVGAVYEVVQRKGSSKTFKAGEMFDAIPETAKLPRQRRVFNNSDSYNPFYAKANEDSEKEELWMENRGFINPNDLTSTQKKELQKTNSIPVDTGSRTPKEILAQEYGIIFSFDITSKSFKFVGDDWDEIPDDMKKDIKTPSQLLSFLNFNYTTPAPKVTVETEDSKLPLNVPKLSKTAEKGISDMDKRNELMKMMFGSSSEETTPAPTQEDKNVPAVGLSKVALEGISDMEKRNQLMNLMFGNNNPLNDECA